MKTFALLALLASVTLADPAAPAAPAAAPVAGVISQDDTGYVVKTEVIQDYTRLCKLFPNLGVKPGDGVFVVDEGVFHLDTEHYNDYVAMLAREHSVAIGGSPAAPAKSAN
jgi:hypothetical protein